LLGARIAALRKNIGMSQAELAKALAISPSTVGMYEQGRRQPSVEMLTQLSRVFQVSIDFLVTGNPSSEQERQAINNLLLERVTAAEQLGDKRVRPFSRQELAVLFAAMLMEP